MNGMREPRLVESHNLVSAAFSLRWTSGVGQHTDVFHFAKLNVWRDLDLLPPELQREVLARPSGHVGTVGFPAGVLVERWSPRNLVRARSRQFNRGWLKYRQIEPRLGRFYPKGVLQGVAGIYPEDHGPARLIGATENELELDFNHPLACYAVDVGVTGLGMNRDELDASPVLGQKLVHDLNEDPRLPFPEQSFDAVLCTVSVEYLVRPFEVFQEVARVLRPGGVFALTFSSRWFPPKVIDLWQNLHEFERPALVLEYFLESGDFERLHTFSERGLLRPEDDRYAAQAYFSDPIHAVWGHRQSRCRSRAV